MIKPPPAVAARQNREKIFWNQHYSPNMYNDWQEQSYESWRDWVATRQAASAFLGSLVNKRLLICSVGPEAIMFAHAGAEVSGFDISETVIHAVDALVRREHLSDRIALRVVPFENMGYPSNHFDLAFGTAILHHIDLEAGSAELRRVLKPGGRAAFIEPLGMNPLLQFARHYLPYRGKGRTQDERPMTYADIRSFSAAFPYACFEECNLLAMLSGRVVTSPRLISRLKRIDRVLLKKMPVLRRFCSGVWIGVEKGRE